MTAGPDVQAAFAATVVDEWARAGVAHAVVAPGSRSTPLTLALAADSRIRVHVVLDERSAGFVALGVGLSGAGPAVVATTSGTAAVELHPAVVEAHHAGVPLLAVTADRPAELHGVGAPQTVDQDGLFGRAVRWAAAPGVPDGQAAGSWRSLASRAVREATAGRGGPGPVHLNLAFREPLLGQARALPAGRPDGSPWHRLEGANPLAPTAEAVDRLVRKRCGVVVAGAGAGDPESVHALATTLGWPVLADPLSGCRIPSPATVAAADALLRCGHVAGWRPDVVLRLGRPWASRVVNGWLAGLGPQVEQVLVDPVGAWPDPDRVASGVVHADPGAVCLAVVAAVAGASGRHHAAAAGWAGGWAAAEAVAQAAIDDVMAAHPEVTEPGAARSLLTVLPHGASLFCSSSMPIRDLEWYTAPREGVRVFANRGANGIDGVVSTALGVALADPSRPTAALMGDLAFLYDAGALLGAGRLGVSLTMIVVDNDGGGIFSFLPQASAVPSETFERLWGTPPGIDVAAVAGAYGVPVERVEHSAHLGPAITAAVAAGGVRLVLVPTDRRGNVAIHDEIHRAVAQAVERAGLPTAAGAG
jgi:2-succinyl-5-enolpyruvyl-6-hydroxy-3-cyclohexene-1-carboxylate synthase